MTTIERTNTFFDGLSISQEADLLKRMKAATKDAAEHLSARRALEDAGAPLATVAPVVVEDENTARAFEAMMAGRADATDGGRLLSMRWIRDAIESPPLEPEVLIDGMLRTNELAVLGAPRGIGKSFFAENAAILGGRGEGFLGGALRILRPCKTLIFQGEIDPWESSRRWGMLTGGNEPPEGVAETFDRVRVRTIRKRSSNSGGVDDNRWSESNEWIDAVLDPRVEETIAEHGFDLFIIDPWAVFYSGKENDNDEVEAALDKLRDLSMRQRVAVWIIHHLGKSNEARDPEDLWRGASRLADWASTRITLLPHYTERQAEAQGMTRQQARRYVDVKFLRRSTPTEDFSMVLDSETGWWSKWKAPEQAADSRRIHLDVPDLVDALRTSGGSWASKVVAAEAMGVARDTVTKLLATAIRAGAIETTSGARGATVYYLPGAHLGDEL